MKNFSCFGVILKEWESLLGWRVEVRREDRRQERVQSVFLRLSCSCWHVMWCSSQTQLHTERRHIVSRCCCKCSPTRGKRETHSFLPVLRVSSSCAPLWGQEPWDGDLAERQQMKTSRLHPRRRSVPTLNTFPPHSSLWQKSWCIKCFRGKNSSWVWGVRRGISTCFSSLTGCRANIK